MAGALASTRELLTMPSPAVAAMVRQDPLDLLGLLRQQLGGQRAGITAGITEGGYVSADGRRRLVIAKPRRPPFDTGFSHLLMQRLDAIGAAQRSAARPDDDEPAPPLEVAFAGGHRIAIETEAVVRRESILNGVGSLALILPLLYLVFRSVWLLVCGALPSLMSLVVALGLMGLGGATLSAAATGASAMLFGLGIDGVVLVYIAHRLALADGLGVTESVATLGGPSASMLLGMLTTAATFYGLVFVDFPSLQQLGLVIGHSMVACGVLTLVLVPALLPRHRPRGPIRVLTWPSLASWITRHRTRVLVASAVVDGRARRGLARASRGHVAGAHAIDHAGRRCYEESVRKMFGLPSDVYVWLQHGPALEPLLQANEAMVARVRDEAPGSRSTPLRPCCRPTPAQERSMARVRASGAAAAGGAGQPGARGVGRGIPRRARSIRFCSGCPKLLDPGQRLTFDGYRDARPGRPDRPVRLARTGRLDARDVRVSVEPGEARALERIAGGRAAARGG